MLLLIMRVSICLDKLVFKSVSPSFLFSLPEAASQAVTPPVDRVIEPPEAAVPGLAEVQEEAEAGDEEASEHRGPASGVMRGWGAVAGIDRGLAITQRTVRIVISPAWISWKKRNVCLCQLSSSGSSLNSRTL